MGDLLSKKVKVAGRTITVHKATFVMSLQRSVSQANAIKEASNGIYKNLDDSVVNYVHQRLYPTLAVCSEGKVPTEEEFLNLLQEDVDRWIAAASELNPDWFTLENESAAVKETK